MAWSDSMGRLTAEPPTGNEDRADILVSAGQF